MDIYLKSYDWNPRHLEAFVREEYKDKSRDIQKQYKFKLKTNIINHQKDSSTKIKPICRSFINSRLRIETGNGPVRVPIENVSVDDNIIVEKIINKVNKVEKVEKVQEVIEEVESSESAEDITDGEEEEDRTASESDGETTFVPNMNNFYKRTKQFGVWHPVNIKMNLDDILNTPEYLELKKLNLLPNWIENIYAPNCLIDVQYINLKTEYRKIMP